MKVQVFSLVTYFGSDGDAVEVFATARERDAAALEYAREHWQQSACNGLRPGCGDASALCRCPVVLPVTLADASERMDFDSCANRWECTDHVLDVAAEGAPHPDYGLDALAEVIRGALAGDAARVTEGADALARYLKDGGVAWRL
jgi:hypothetical protein